MEEFGVNKIRNHKITVIDRKSCTIYGVSDVLSFDVNEIMLETEEGMLMIRGDGLHVNQLNLDKGEIDVDGQIDSLTYSEAGKGAMKGESLIARLFK